MTARNRLRPRGFLRIRRAIVVATLAAVALATLWPFPYQSSLHNPNELARVLTTMALVDEGTLAIDPLVARHGSVLDAAVVAGPSGRRTFSVKAPGTSLLGVPVYAAWRLAATVTGLAPRGAVTPEADAAWLRRSIWVIRLFTVQVPCVAFALFFARTLRRFVRDATIRLAAVVALAVGTNFLAYALMAVSHSQVAIATFVGWSLLTAEWTRTSAGHAPSPRRLAAAGAAVGLATLLEYQAAIASLGLSLYLVALLRRAWGDHRRAALRSAGAFTLAVLPSAVAMMLVHWIAFGSPFTPGHDHAIDPTMAAAHGRGLYGLSLRNVSGFATIIEDVWSGLFVAAPLTAVGAIGLVRELRLRSEVARRDLRLPFAVALFVSLNVVAVVSGMRGWWIGWTVGPRYLVLVLPWLVLGAARGLDGLWLLPSVGRGVACGLAAVGVLSTGLPSTLYNTIPPEISAPLRQLALPLVRAELGPYNLGHVIGWTAWSSTVVVLTALGLAALGPALSLVTLRPRDGVRSAAVALVAFSLAALPHLDAGDTIAAQRARGALLAPGTFEPQTGGDKVSRLLARASRGDARDGDARELCARLVELGRDAPAAAWCARARGDAP